MYGLAIEVQGSDNILFIIEYLILIKYYYTIPCRAALSTLSLCLYSRLHLGRIAAARQVS
jgi:hypothetical protein